MKEIPRRAITQHFQENPHDHLSEWSFDWWREPLGLNNQYYEVVCEAKQQRANANSMDFNKEQAAYTKAKKAKEGQRVIGHTVWQTRGAAPSWPTSDDEPVAVTVKGSRSFLSSLGELTDAGPDPLSVGPAEPCGDSDHTGPLMVHDVYGVKNVEEDGESDAILVFTIQPGTTFDDLQEERRSG